MTLEWIDGKEHYCPCGGSCHTDKSPCSLSCVSHHHLLKKPIDFHLRYYMTKKEIELAKKLPGRCGQSSEFKILSLFHFALKDTEMREAKVFWVRALTNIDLAKEKLSDFPLWEGREGIHDLTSRLRVNWARLIECYPKNNLPRREGVITGLWWSKTDDILGIVIPESVGVS